MTLSMYSQSVPVFVRNLNNLSAILDKTARHCADHKIDSAVLLAARLYPDMLPFTRQVLIACDFAKGASARLAGVEVPKWEDNETTIDDLKARIAKTIAYVQTLDEAQFAGSDARTITITLRNETRNFVGLPYLTSYVLPNFYFHATTAYAILRHNGVPLGKSDFIGALS